MHLYLSDTSPLNSTFRNEHSQALYKVECPRALSSRTAKISRVVQDQLVPIGEVQFHKIGPSVLRFGSNEIAAQDFFRKKFWGLNGRSRVFTGPDGLEYRWELGGNSPKLYLENRGSTQTLVAQFHQRHHGFLRESRDASLEIFPGGERILDTIVITLVFIEKKRKDSQRNRNTAVTAAATS